uniref:protein-serine/threonine phosphatase n=1 Tax=Zea mays TaxID=4577 RepID=A0A804PRT1_MAIZE
MREREFVAAATAKVEIGGDSAPEPCPGGSIVDAKSVRGAIGSRTGRFRPEFLNSVGPPPPTRLVSWTTSPRDPTELRRSRRLDVVQSGCTALSIVKHGDLMVVANVDDSRVVLGIATYDDAITPSSSSST